MAENHATTPLSDVQEALLDEPDFLRGIVQGALQEILEAEMCEHVGARPHERTPERTGQRNGYKPRKLTTRVGTLTLRVPQDREGTFSSAIFARYQRSEKALVLALMEMYVVGVSTRKVARVTEELCGIAFSKSAVSALCATLDEQLEVWRSRPLTESAYPYLAIDATYEKVRRAGRVVSVGVLIAQGVRALDGRREILAVACADTESAATWGALFGSLKDRGLTGVQLVTSDAHPGIKAAVSRHFQGASWQRCQTHFQGDQADKISFRHRKGLAAEIRDVFEAPDLSSALRRAEAAADRWRDLSPQVADALEEEVEECLTVFAFPAAHRKRLRTTNGLERLNEEIKRRTKVVRIFPNEASCLRLVSALAIETSEEWVTGRRYLDMTLLEQMREAEAEQPETSESEGVTPLATAL
jgi:putative transposase